MGKSTREPFVKIKNPKKRKKFQGRTKKSNERNILSVLERSSDDQDSILDLAEMLETFASLRQQTKWKKVRILSKEDVLSEKEFENLRRK